LVTDKNPNTALSETSTRKPAINPHADRHPGQHSCTPITGRAPRAGVPVMGTGIGLGRADAAARTAPAQAFSAVGRSPPVGADPPPPRGPRPPQLALSARRYHSQVVAHRVAAQHSPSHADLTPLLKDWVGFAGAFWEHTITISMCHDHRAFVEQRADVTGGRVCGR
jgi:hypothetical protein